MPFDGHWVLGMKKQSIGYVVDWQSTIGPLDYKI